MPLVESRVQVQMGHSKLGVEFGFDEEASEYQPELEEAMLLLSPGARHDNVVRLLGVVLDVGRVRQLVFELADEGSIENHIGRLLTSSDKGCESCTGCRKH